MITTQFDTNKLENICREHDVVMLGVFGSVARGEETEHSDIDLIVRFAKPKGLLDMVRLERILSKVFKRKVDLLTEAAISPYIQDTVLDDLRVIYGAR